MANGTKFIPLRGINTDLSEQFMQPDQAYFIKNLYYELTDQSNSGTSEGSKLGVMKPNQGNAVYAPFTLPNGDNYSIGSFHEKELSQLYIFLWNSLDNHSIYRLNGKLGTIDSVYVGSELEFEYNPENFIHEAGADIKVVHLTNPKTNEVVTRTFLFWTNGKSRQKFLSVEDSIETNSFDINQYSYFHGDYDKKLLLSVGQPHFMDCFGISEIPNTTPELNNNLLYHGVQFRITYIDVWGRPSEHSIISDLYVPTYANCSNSISNQARSLNITFDAGIPTIDKIQIEYSFDNSTQWYLDTIIDKYEGSNIGKWWLRNYNRLATSGFTYNPLTNQIDYIFSGDKSGEPIDVNETNRLFNPLPITSQVGTYLGKSEALYNNTYGFTPIDKKVLNEIDFKVESQAVVSPSVQLRNITIYSKIWNRAANSQSLVFNTNPTDLSKGYYCFGNDWRRPMKPYKQNFATDQQRGWLGYLAGTNNAVYSEQGYFDNNWNFVVFTDDDYKDPQNRIFTNNGAAIDVYQRWVFTGVIPSVYSFRIASHLSDTSVDYEKTSTYVNGLYAFTPMANNSLRFQYGNITTLTMTDAEAYKEIVIDVVNRNFDTIFDKPTNGSSSTRMIVLEDLYTQGSYVSFGYIYESSVNKVPVENSLYTYYGKNGIVGSGTFTDYNGFYYVSFDYGYPLPALDIQFLITFNGNTYWKILVKSLTYILEYGYVDTEISGYSSYTLKTISNVEGDLYACGTTDAISGVPIVMTNVRPSYTDNFGHFKIKVHLSTSGFHNSNNKTNYFINSTNNEYYTDCNGVVFQYPNSNIISIGNVSLWQLTYLLGNGYLLCTKIKSLLTGGRYSIGIAKNDWMDRQGNVNTLDKWFLDVPTISSTKNLQQYAIRVNMPTTVRFTPEVDRISIYVSAELNNEDFITWVADQVDFIDNSGNINVSNPTQIKIWYQSLNQYNKQNNFNTTTGWGIIPTSSTTPRTSDTVEFVFNGDGTYFNKREVARIKYDSTGAYFLIDYTPDLATLKSGAFMRLVHPKTNQGNIIYYEQCHTVKVVDGVPQETSFLLPFFDTYLIQRSIPVSVNKVDTTVTPPVTTTTYSLRTFGFPFEHHSPSDFWGSHIKNIGRINVRNNYENVVLKPNEVAISGALSENGQLNYLCYYQDSLKTTFEINDQSGIVYARQKTGLVLVVTQYANFLVGYNDNLARIDSNGNIAVASGSNIFGKPERKTNGDYGCQLFDKNTLREREGMLQFLDVSRCAVLQHNFSDCTDVSRSNQANSTIVSWLSKKIKSVQNWNSNNANKRYFTGIVNPVNFEYLVTDFCIGNDSYFNDIRDYSYDDNETMAFDIYSKVWKGMYSFTSEYYGVLENDIHNQNQLISIKQGLPYYHYDSSNQSILQWNTFFGQTGNKVYTIVSGIDGQKKKTFRFIENYIKEYNYFSDDITTEANQKSRLLLSQFKKGEYFYQAAFLCNLLTNADVNNPQAANRYPLFEGEPLYGSWIKVRLVGDPQYNNQYSELTGVILHITPREKSGI